ncbi:hypothetical protein BC332_30596 [Capsicum chinense]|nr:hypothetical protein BC332_30596 [Capsicum chinense]
MGEDIMEIYLGWILFFDGAVNFKGSGIRAVLVSKIGQHYPSTAKLHFPYTNNVAEYRAWILGLKLELDIGVCKLLVIGDSDLLIHLVEVTIEATAEQHNITVDNPSTASKEEEKLEPISSGEHKNYPFEGFNILDEVLKKLTKFINDYSEWIADGLLKHHADRDSGHFVAAYAEYLSDGLQVPNDGLDAILLRKIYVALLWKYGEMTAQKSYTNDIKDPQRPKLNFIAPDEE